jgi:tellurite resistance protein TerC
MKHDVLTWVLFNVGIIGLLALDLGVFHKKSHSVSIKEALGWSAVWITLALLFNGGLWIVEGKAVALEFLAGYLIEKSLSVDNLFVILLIFSYFRVPAAYQHKILFWGILGALIMRGILIIVGSALLAQFHWIIYIFGAFLVFTGIRMFFQDEDPDIHPEKNLFVRLFKKMYPVTHEYHGDKFFIVQNGVKFATPLIIVLIVVEMTDLVFAVDSIPAIFAVTRDPFIVYTSNVFAILGLRSLYFALAGIMDMFHYLKYGLAIVLGFVGAKMLLSELYPIPIGIALAVIAGILTISVVLSLIYAKEHEDDKKEPGKGPQDTLPPSEQNDDQQPPRL